MKEKTFVIGTVCFFLMLDFLALDDIATGRESSFFLEYTILLLSLVVFGIIGIRFWGKSRVK